MAEEKAENTTNKDTAADDSRVQDQILDAMKRSQEAALKVVSAWSESVAKLTPKLPEMPKMPKIPMIDALPTTGEVSEKFFGFAKDLLNAQHDFVQRLMDALPGHDKPSDS